MNDPKWLYDHTYLKIKRYNTKHFRQLKLLTLFERIISWPFQMVLTKPWSVLFSKKYFLKTVYPCDKVYASNNLFRPQPPSKKILVQNSILNMSINKSFCFFIKFIFGKRAKFRDQSMLALTSFHSPGINVQINNLWVNNPKFKNPVMVQRSSACP